MRVARRAVAKVFSVRSSGQAAVETAAALAVLVPVLIGCVDLGRAYFAYDVVVHAVNEGARVGSFNPSYSNVRTTVVNAGETVGIASGDVTVTCYSGSSTATKTCSPTSMVSGDSVEVNASVVFRPLTPLITAILPGGTLTIGGTAQRTYQ